MTNAFSPLLYQLSHQPLSQKMPQRKSVACLPTPQQELLLRAALLDGQEAVEAFRVWQGQVDLDKLDDGSSRLLPLLYKNLKKNRVQDSCMGKLKAIYRQTFLDNQVLLYKSLPALRALKAAGIELMLLKGAALCVSHYEDSGMRPMCDIDILVPTAKSREATAVLSTLGCTPLFKAVHAQSFRTPDGVELDLHWHALLEFSQENSDDYFWAKARAATIYNLAVLIPDSTDALFHVCIHGLKWNEIPPIRWIADAQVILRAESTIDWHRLLRLAKRHRLMLRLKESLQYLKRLLHAPIPEEILAELEADSI
ncbi:MAG: nucleotidyltransferase domain-containing protein, partial [Terriglobales bacterium]